MSIYEEFKEVERKINMQELTVRLSHNEIVKYTSIVNKITSAVSEDLKFLYKLKKLPLVSLCYRFVSKKELIETLRNSFTNDYYFFLYVFVVFSMNKRNEINALSEAIYCKENNNYDILAEVLLELYQSKSIKL